MEIEDILEGETLDTRDITPEIEEKQKKVLLAVDKQVSYLKVEIAEIEAREAY